MQTATNTFSLLTLPPCPLDGHNTPNTSVRNTGSSGPQEAASSRAGKRANTPSATEKVRHSRPCSQLPKLLRTCNASGWKGGRQVARRGRCAFE